MTQTTTPDMMARYFDDLEVGDSFITKGRTITEADLVNFAALTWDTYPLHVDAEWASKTMFGERIAHGMLVLSYAAGLVPMQPGPDRRLLRDGQGPLLRADQDRRHDPRARRAQGEGGARREPRPRDVPQHDPQPARRDRGEVDQQGRPEAARGLGTMALAEPSRLTKPLPGGQEGATVRSTRSSRA